MYNKISFSTNINRNSLKPVWTNLVQPELRLRQFGPQSGFYETHVVETSINHKKPFSTQRGKDITNHCIINTSVLHIMHIMQSTHVPLV